MRGVAAPAEVQDRPRKHTFPLLGRISSEKYWSYAVVGHKNSCVGTKATQVKCKAHLIWALLSGLITQRCVAAACTCCNTFFFLHLTSKSWKAFFIFLLDDSFLVSTHKMHDISSFFCPVFFFFSFVFLSLLFCKDSWEDFTDLVEQMHMLDEFKGAYGSIPPHPLPPPCAGPLQAPPHSNPPAEGWLGSWPCMPTLHSAHTNTLSAVTVHIC